eukprot:scaffold1307_cov200-Pinguiococcus_pyrenoidosus.AAC.61
MCVCATCEEKEAAEVDADYGEIESQRMEGPIIYNPEDPDCTDAGWKAVFTVCAVDRTFPA